MKTAVFVIPWVPYPLHFGGALRAFNIAKQLRREFHTEIYIPAGDIDVENEIRDAMGKQSGGLQVKCVEYRSNTRGLARRAVEKLITAWDSQCLSVPVNSLSMAFRKTLRERFHASHPDLVVLTELETMQCARLTKRLMPSVPIVVDMHNVNYRLQQRMSDADPANARQWAGSHELFTRESRLYKWADYCFACSADDLTELQAANDQRLPGFVVPNGVDTKACPFQMSTRAPLSRKLIFCASLTTEANISGLIWFYKHVWPEIQQRVPELTLMVVGNDLGDERLTALRKDTTLNFTGRVPELGPRYQEAGVSICPVQIGSGTRLKILEAMSFGNPVVSTSIGCEGLKAVDNHHILIRDTAELFADGILELIQRPDQYFRIAKNARRFVEERYDWDVIGDAMHQDLSKILAGK